MLTDLHSACAQLQQAQDIYILCHKHPDGDTLGSGFALKHALTALGKRTRLLCSDEIPEKYLRFMAAPETREFFPPQYVVAVDIADTQLLGTALEEYRDRIDLCIDHHPSNTDYARWTVVDAKAAATAELIYDLIGLLGVSLDKRMADCIYSGLSTDTGGFRFSNTTSRTHRIAAQVIDAGAQHAAINYQLLEVKSLQRMEVERQVLNSLSYYLDNRVAMLCISRKMLLETGAKEDELDGIAALPRRIAGVEVGITLREQPDGSYKVSLRTNELVDASLVCSKLGGGGHARAAGCTLKMGKEEAVQAVLEQLRPYLQEQTDPQ